MNQEHVWEVETQMVAAYLASNSDLQVRLAMLYMEQLADTKPNGLVAHSLGIGDKYQLTNLLPAIGDESEHLTPKMTANIVRARQKQSLREERVGKTVHGTFAREMNKPECGRTAMHAWLRDGRFGAETKGLSPTKTPHSDRCRNRTTQSPEPAARFSG